MRPIQAMDLLDIWDRGAAAPPLSRAWVVLSAADPALTADTFAALTVGQMHRALIRLRQSLFGPQLDCGATCPACATAVDFTLLTTDLTASRVEPAGVGDVVRPVTVGDVAALAASFDGRPPADLFAGCGPFLLARCATSAAGASDDAVVDQLIRGDPDAVHSVELTCPDCGRAWEEILSPIQYLWADLSACVRRLVGDVHELASAYGWDEREILSMTAARRQLYLDRASRFAN